MVQFQVSWCLGRDVLHKFPEVIHLFEGCRWHMEGLFTVFLLAQCSMVCEIINIPELQLVKFLNLQVLTPNPNDLPVLISVRGYSQMSLSLGDEGMLSCVVSLDLVLNFGMLA